jgi:probable selenium-dependent hydroxylase accessory protein YqeC
MDSPASYTRLIDALGIKQRDIVTLVGAGGKTTIMFALAKELVEQGKRVISTTTTKIRVPSKKDTEVLLFNPEDSALQEALSKHLHVTCVSHLVESDKVAGVEPEVIPRWLAITGVDCIIVEADGSRGKSFKAPASYEPVIPPGTTVYVPVVGVDIIDKELNEDNVHRSQIVAQLANIKMGDTINPKVVAKILNYYLGMKPESSRALVFINKVQSQTQREHSKLIADELEIEKVVYGSVLSSEYWVITER